MAAPSRLPVPSPGPGHHLRKQSREKSLEIDDVFVFVADIRLFFMVDDGFQNPGCTLIGGHSSRLPWVHLRMQGPIALERMQADVGTDVARTNQRDQNSVTADFSAQRIEKDVQSV